MKKYKVIRVFWFGGTRWDPDHPATSSISLSDRQAKGLIRAGKIESITPAKQKSAAKGGE